MQRLVGAVLVGLVAGGLVTAGAVAVASPKPVPRAVTQRPVSHAPTRPHSAATWHQVTATSDVTLAGSGLTLEPVTDGTVPPIPASAAVGLPASPSASAPDVALMRLVSGKIPETPQSDVPDHRLVWYVTSHYTGAFASGPVALTPEQQKSFAAYECTEVTIVDAVTGVGLGAWDHCSPPVASS